MTTTREDAGQGRAAQPPARDPTKDDGVRVLLAVARGKTPTDVAGYIERGWPQDIEALAADPDQYAEMSQFVDVLAHTLESSRALAAAA